MICQVGEEDALWGRGTPRDTLASGDLQEKEGTPSCACTANHSLHKQTHFSNIAPGEKQILVLTQVHQNHPRCFQDMTRLSRCRKSVKC